MRSLIAIAVIVAAALSRAGTADAGGKVDREAAAYQALPEAGRGLVDQLAAAADGKTDEAFVALLPEPIDLGGVTYTRAELAKAIAGHGGIARAFDLGKGAWTVTDVDGRLTVHRGASVIGFVIAEVDGAWIVDGVVDDTGDSGVLSLLHPEQIVVFDRPRPFTSKRCVAGLRAPMTMSAPQVSAGLRKAIVRRALEGSRAKLLYCYEKQTIADPLLAGTVTTSFSIDDRGQVDSVSSSGISPVVSSCIAQVVDVLETPAPSRAPVRVTFELVAAPFDDKVFACSDLPAPMRTLAERLARAIERGDARAFVKRMPAKLPDRGRTLSRAEVKTAIAGHDDGLAGWLGMQRGPWSIEPGAGKNTFRLMRFDPSAGLGVGAVAGDPVNVITVIELARSGGKWKVRSIQRGCHGTC